MNSRRELIDDLLQATSRTFALAIPLLPEPLRAEVGIGYLLLRIADTLEDAERLNRDERLEELSRFRHLLAEPSTPAAQSLADRWAARPTSTNEEYNRLLRETPAVFDALRSLDPGSMLILTAHTLRSAEGMASTLRRADAAGSLHLDSVDDLRQYCYFVAGIVGEMLTELFQQRFEASAASQALGADAAAFGEGLQLVNILKDAADDADDGRAYLPDSASREAAIELARADLIAAERYANNLRAAGAEPGVIAFATLPRTLAESTLDVLQSGVGTKVSRDTVAAKLAEARAAAGAGE